MPDALVWGASGGIGRALVSHLKANSSDWQVFAAARDESRIPPEADFTYSFDAASAESIADVSMAVAHDTGGIDLMVYAAGVMLAKPIEQLAPDEWLRVMDANLHGVYRTTHGALNLLQDDAHIMVIGAYVDKISLPRFGAYAAAKAALEPLLTALQKEHRALKCTLVRVGAVDTPFWSNVPFSLPKGALQPAAVAEALLNRYNSGDKGFLDL